MKVLLGLHSYRLKAKRRVCSRCPLDASHIPKVAVPTPDGMGTVQCSYVVQIEYQVSASRMWPIWAVKREREKLSQRHKKYKDNSPRAGYSATGETLDDRNNLNQWKRNRIEPWSFPIVVKTDKYKRVLFFFFFP